MDVSIPPVFSSDFSQCAMMLAVNALCGFMIAINSLGSPFLRDFVLILYALMVVIEHKVRLPIKNGKKKLDNGLPCFAGLLGKKAKPPGLCCLPVIHSCDLSVDLERRIRSNKRGCLSF